MAAPAPPLKEWRCSKCGNLLAKLWLGRGTVEIKCRSCNSYNTREAAA